MFTFGKRFAVLAVLALGVVLGPSQPAHAILTVTLTDTGATTAGPLTITDQVAPDASPAIGNIDYVADFGSFSTGTGSGVTLNVLSNALSLQDPSTLREITIGIRNSTPTTQTLTIVSTDQFTTPPGSPVTVNQGLAINPLGIFLGTPATGAGVTYESFLNGNSIGQISLTAAGTVGSEAVLASSTPYTLQSITRITLGGGGSAQLTATTMVSAVPEPGTMAMACAGLGSLGFGRWIRRRRVQA